MYPADVEGIWAVLLAIVPGFLATTVWARAKTWRGPIGDLRTILHSLALSAAIQVVVAPLTIALVVPHRTDLQDHLGSVLLWAAITVIVVPIGGGVLAGWMSDRIFNPRSLTSTGVLRSWLSRIWPPAPPPTMWDWLFTSTVPHGKFIVIEFEDGTRKAGVFANGSVALTSPEPHGLFLVSEWEMDEDGNVVSEIPGTAGITILDTSKVRAIQILNPGDDDEDEQDGS